MRKIAIIDYSVPAARTAELARELNADGEVGLIVLFRSRIPPECDGDGGKTVLSENYLEDSDYRAIDRFAYSLVRGWYRRPEPSPGRGGQTLPVAADGPVAPPQRITPSTPQGITELNGTHYGFFVEYKFAETLLRIIKDTTALSRALRGCTSAALCCASPEFAETADFMCGQLGIRPEWRMARPRPAVHEIYGKGEWDAVGNGAADLFESLASLALSRKGEERRALIHDASGFRALFAEAGYEATDFAPGRSRLRMTATLLRNWRIILKARKAARKTAVAAHAHFAEAWERLREDAGFHAVFTYGGINFWPLVKPYLEDALTARIPAMARALAYRSTLYNALGVEGIIVNDDVQMIKRIDLAASRCPSLYVQHGVSGEINGEDALTADMMAVWGEADAEKYAVRGNDRDRLAVTGNPKYDKILRCLDAPPKAWKDEVALALGLGDLSNLVVFATQVAPKRSAYDTDDEEEVLAWAVCRAMAQFPRKRLIMKLHPNQRGREAAYREIARRCGLKDFGVVREIALSKLLAQCELFITESSTAAYEACLWDLPVLIVNLTKREDVVPYVRGGVALGAYAEEDIVLMLKRLIESDQSRMELAANRKEFIRRHLYKTDGRATYRLAEVMARLLERGPVENRGQLRLAWKR
jgi:hypothetical protein